MAVSSNAPAEKAARRLPPSDDDETPSAAERTGKPATALNEKQQAEMSSRLTRIVSSRCEDVDEGYRTAFLADGERILAAAPKGKKAEYWDAYAKVFEKKAARSAALRASAGAETLTGTMIAATLTIGGFVIVDDGGASLPVLLPRQTSTRPSLRRDWTSWRS